MAEETVVTNIVATSNFSSLIADVHRVSSALSGLQQSLATTNQSLALQAAQIQKSFGQTLRSTGQFSSHFVSLTSDVEKFGKGLDSGQLKLKQYYNAWNQQSKTAGGLVRDLAKQQVQMQNAILQPLGKNAQGLMQFNVHIPQGLDAIKSKSALASQELQIMNKVIQQGANQVINWGKNTQWAGRQLTVGLTVPLAAFGAAAANAFKLADQELVRLTKVYGGLAATSTADLQKIRAEVSATASDIAKSYGQAYKDTISLAADIAATGKTGNDLLAATRQTSRLAVLGETSVQDAMKATLSIQNTFKSSTDELTQSIDFLNAVENQTSTTMGDLIIAIPKAGPVIKAMGGSVKDLSLMLVAMKEGGIDATQGANALKSALASLINPTKVAVGMFKGFGIDLKGIVTKNAGNLTGTIMELQGALDKLDPLKKQQAIEQLFGKFQFARMNALFANLGKQGSQTLQVLDLMKASSQDLANVSARELSQVTESASGKYKRALEGLKADLAGVGNQFLFINTQVIHMVDGILKFVNHLPGPVKSILALFGGLTALAGPMIMLTGVLANFFGYIVKGVYHFKSLFRGGEGWKLLTPEILAAQEAGSLVEKTFYSDAKAAAVLQQALANLASEFTLLETKAKAGAIAVGPALSTMAGNVVVPGAQGQRMADKNSPFVGKPYSRQMAHLIPSQTQQPGTIFGVVPNPGPVNQRIGKNPQMYMSEDLPKIQGVTSVGKVSTGIVAAEAAKWHAMTGALSMQSEAELKVLKAEVNATGTITAELSASYQALLPQMTQLTQKAAIESAMIVEELQADKINVDQARAKIVTLNAEIEAMMAQTATGVATAQGRVANLTSVPLLNQPIVDPMTGKSNMKELTRPGRTSTLIDKIARNLGVKTSGGGYSIQTTMPKRLAHGGTAIGLPKYAVGEVAIKAGQRGANLLREYWKSRSKIGGLRTPARPGSGHGPSPIGASETGVEIPYGKVYKKNSAFYKDPENIAWGLTPVSGTDVLMHAAVPPSVARTANLESGKYSTPHGPMDTLREMGVSTSSKKDIGITLPNELIKNSEKFNTNLGNGSAVGWRQVNYLDMFGLLGFLKTQGMPRIKAFELASRAARNLNEAMSNHQGPLTEEMFGKYVYRSNQKAILSAFPRASTKIPARDPFRNDPFWDRGGKPEGNRGYQQGVTQVPGYGGGDIIPALIEPGESVVTKEATSGNEGAISFMNAGGKIPGFKDGVTGLRGKGSSIISGGASMTGGLGASMIAGNLTSKMGITNGIAQMVIQMAAWSAGQSAISKVLKATLLKSTVAGEAAGLSARLASGASILGKYGVALGRAAMFAKSFAGPIGLVTTALAIGYGFYKKHQDALKLQALGYGMTADAAKKAGLTYTNLNQEVKDAIKNSQLLAEKNKLIYATTTLSNTPLKITIAEYGKLKDSIKATMPEYIKLVNATKVNEVGDLATRLKAQFMAAGLSVEDATKKVYALIAVSNKSGMAGGAVSSTSFAGVTDQKIAAVQNVKTLNAGIALKIPGQNQADQFFTTLQSINSGIDEIQKKSQAAATLDISGKTKAITLDKAQQQQIDLINKTLGKQKTISQDLISSVAKQNPELAKVLNTSDNIESSWAKYQLILSGVNVDLTTMTGKSAIALQQIQSAVTNITSSQLHSTLLKTQYARIQVLTDMQKKLTLSAAGQSVQSQIDSKKQLQIINDRIDAINKEADARKKALEDQTSIEDANLQIKKKQLEYQDALAAGDMAAAAQAQLDISGLVNTQQKTAALNAIEAKRVKDITPLQSQAKNIDAANTAQADAAALAAQKLADTTKELDILTTATDKVTAAFTKIESGIATLGDAYKNSPAYKNDLAALTQALKDGSITPSTAGVTPSKIYGLAGHTAGTVAKTAEEMAKEAIDKKIADIASSIKTDKVVITAQSVVLAEANSVGKAGVYGQSDLKTDKQGYKSLDQQARNRIMTDPQLMKQFNLSTKGSKFVFDGVTYVSTGGINAKLVVSDYGTNAPVKKAMGGYIKNYAAAGFVSGAGNGTSDSIPAYLSNGEYVINAKSVQAAGLPMLDRINKMAAGGLATRYNIPSSMPRVGYADAGLVTSHSNDSYNINVTLNGSNLDANDVANVIAQKMKLINTKSGDIGRYRP